MKNFIIKGELSNKGEYLAYSARTPFGDFFNKFIGKLGITSADDSHKAIEKFIEDTGREIYISDMKKSEIGYYMKPFFNDDNIIYSLTASEPSANDYCFMNQLKS